MVNDPGAFLYTRKSLRIAHISTLKLIGMVNANMVLVILSVVLPDKLETPGQKLDPGELIVTRVVELGKLKDGVLLYPIPGCCTDLSLSQQNMIARYVSNNPPSVSRGLGSLEL